MRWREPKEDDRRCRVAFLLLPRSINGETRWLEWATWEQKSWRGALSGRLWWDDYQWIDGDA